MLSTTKWQMPHRLPLRTCKLDTCLIPDVSISWLTLRLDPYGRTMWMWSPIIHPGRGAHALAGKTLRLNGMPFPKFIDSFVDEFNENVEH